MTLHRASVPPDLSWDATAQARPRGPVRAVEPLEIPVSLSMAREARDNGDLKGAQRILEGVIARAPEHSAAWHLLASVYRSWGMYAAALGAMQKAIAAEPERV